MHGSALKNGISIEFLNVHERPSLAKLSNVCTFSHFLYVYRPRHTSKASYYNARNTKPNRMCFKKIKLNETTN